MRLDAALVEEPTIRGPEEPIKVQHDVPTCIVPQLGSHHAHAQRTEPLHNTNQARCLR